MRNDKSLPFGMIFEEYPSVEENIPSVYDEEAGLSVIIQENGEKIPYVELPSLIATKTLTNVSNASDVDEDNDSSLILSTKTISEVKSESTDSDEQAFFATSTQTATKVKSEGSDDDVERSPLKTRTMTAVVRETSDSDNI